MGNVFSSADGTSVGLYMNDTPTFPPQTGFAKLRKAREMCATEEALVSARIPLENRDYCAHKLLEYHQCRYDKFPMIFKCAHEKHNYLNCEHEDYVIRMKEFEREKRLRQREARLASAH